MHTAQLQQLMMQRHAQLRAQAEELGDAHRELQRWEEETTRRDEALRQRRRERLKREQGERKQEQQEGPPEAAEAEALRAEGNGLYQRGAFEAAADCYSRCLAIDRCDMHLYGRRFTACVRSDAHLPHTTYSHLDPAKASWRSRTGPWPI